MTVVISKAHLISTRGHCMCSDSVFCYSHGSYAAVANELFDYYNIFSGLKGPRSRALATVI